MKQPNASLSKSVHTFDYKGFTVQCNYGKYSIIGHGKKEYKSAKAAMAVIDKMDGGENFINVRKNHR